MNNNDFKYNTIEEALAALRAGRIILVTDDEDRENEGDMRKISISWLPMPRDLSVLR